MAVKPPDPSGSVLDRLAMRLAMARAGAERNLLGSMLAHLPLDLDVSRGMAIAEECGVTACHFEHDDHRLIFSAIELAHHRGIELVLRAARYSLRHFGYWDDGAVNWRSFHWSDRKLVRLAESYPSPIPVRANAAHLVNLIQRLRGAEEHLRHAHRLLEGDGL